MAELKDNALITLEELKEYIQESSPDRDNLFITFINSMSDFADSYTDRNIREAIYTDLELDGNGQKELWLPNYPVDSVTKLEEDDIELTEGNDNDYILYAPEGRLVKVSGVWLKGYKTIKLTYKAGYACTAIPYDLRLACMKQIAKEWNDYKMKRWGESARSSEDGSVSMFEMSLLPDVKEILNRYRRFSL